MHDIRCKRSHHVVGSNLCCSPLKLAAVSDHFCSKLFYVPRVQVHTVYLCRECAYTAPDALALKHLMSLSHHQPCTSMKQKSNSKSISIRLKSVVTQAQRACVSALCHYHATCALVSTDVVIASIAFSASTRRHRCQYAPTAELRFFGSFTREYSLHRGHRYCVGHTR